MPLWVTTGRRLNIARIRFMTKQSKCFTNFL
nr:MAG TPA: hypothetical protein [Caudoviricetes sp.]